MCGSQLFFFFCSSWLEMCKLYAQLAILTTFETFGLPLAFLTASKKFEVLHQYTGLWTQSCRQLFEALATSCLQDLARKIPPTLQRWSKLLNMFSGFYIIRFAILVMTAFSSGFQISGHSAVFEKIRLSLELRSFASLCCIF